MRVGTTLSARVVLDQGVEYPWVHGDNLDISEIGACGPGIPPCVRGQR